MDRDIAAERADLANRIARGEASATALDDFDRENGLARQEGTTGLAEPAAAEPGAGDASGSGPAGPSGGSPEGSAGS